MFQMKLTRTFDVLSDAALSIVYPQPCAVCETECVESRADAPACSKCWRATRVFTGDETFCWKCGVPALASVPVEKRNRVRCQRCNDEAFTAARACGLYEGALRASVLKLKSEPLVHERLANLLARAATRAPLNTATLTVPVPLHAERERERGFNQAALLARGLAKRAGLRLDEWSLARIEHSARHRAGMDARARRETVESAFAVTRPRVVEGERVLLVDDVFTTGATVSACAATLLAAGASDVFVLTAARVNS